MDFQLIPPHNHRRNSTERGIRTFKNHFIASICSTRPDLPLNQWDTLLEQATITLIILRPSRINSKLSEHSLLEGEFNFNRTPLAPPGTRVIVHENPAQRASWAPHGIHGWFTDSPLLHYRYYRCYISSTNSTRDSCTVAFFLHNFPMLRTSFTDAATNGVLYLIIALQNPIPASPFNISNPIYAPCINWTTFSHTTAPKPTLHQVSSPTESLPLPHIILLQKNTQPPQSPSVAPRVLKPTPTPPFAESPTPPPPSPAIPSPRVVSP